MKPEEFPDEDFVEIIAEGMEDYAIWFSEENCSDDKGIDRLNKINESVHQLNELIDNLRNLPIPLKKEIVDHIVASKI